MRVYAIAMLVSILMLVMMLVLIALAKIRELGCDLRRLELRSMEREQAIWEAIVNLMNSTGQQSDSTEPVAGAK